MDYQKLAVPHPAWLPATIKKTVSVGKGRERKAVCLDFSKASSTVFCSIFIAKLVKRSLEMWTGNKVCLENELQRVVFTDRGAKFVRV